MIGIFDSGLGGLTVLKEIKKQLPDYDYIYLGDSARTPYGNKSQDVIFEYTCQGIDFLFSRGCELIILACNTASAKALRRIQQEYLPVKHPNKKVLGVLIPVVEELAEEINRNKKNNKITTGIIGTKATIRSEVYEKEIEKLKINTKVLNRATPLLVPLVEEGWVDNKITELTLRKYLRPLKEKDIDYLILACTHYPFLETVIKKQLSKKTTIINTPQAVAKRLRVYLEKHLEIEKKLGKNTRMKIFTTDSKERFERFLGKFVGGDFEVEKIKIPS